MVLAREGADRLRRRRGVTWGRIRTISPLAPVQHRLRLRTSGVGCAEQTAGRAEGEQRHDVEREETGPHENCLTSQSAAGVAGHFLRIGKALSLQRGQKFFSARDR